jgi:streptogramin lyase
VGNQFKDDVYSFDWTSGADLGVFASGGGLLNPITPVFGKDRNLYVNSFSPAEILRYDGTTGAFIDSFASGGGLTTPVDVRFGPDGNLYVVDGTDAFRYDGTTGAFIDVFTSGGPSGFGSTIVFGPYDGHLYMTNNDQVSRFDGITGVYIDDFVASGSGGLDTPTGLAFGPNGNLFVVSFRGEELLEYDGTTGSFVGLFVLPGGQAHGLLFVPEPRGSLMLLSGLSLLSVLAYRRLLARGGAGA